MDPRKAVGNLKKHIDNETMKTNTQQTTRVWRKTKDKDDSRKHKKDAANKKHHTFDWKRLEDKPEDWEKIAQLSRFQTDEVLNVEMLDNSLYIQAMIEKFPHVERLFAENGYSGANGASNNKKKKSNKADLHLRIQKQTIKKEVDGMMIDMKLLYPRKIRNASAIIPYLEMILWAELLLKSSHHVKAQRPVVFLDMVISVNRAYHDLRPSTIRNVFDALRKRANEHVDNAMYSLLFANPSLMVEPFYEKTSKGWRLYKEQIDNINLIVRAVEKKEPILIGNQMPTGTGKTFLAVPLAKKMSMLSLKKTLLFACSNELVCTDVARNALIADDLHLWLARVSQDEDNRGDVIMRPYKRCFPAVWKKVYKKDDMEKYGSIEDQWLYYKKSTKRQPDIIVTDLISCLEILKEAPNLGNPFVCYIDEFVSDSSSNKVMTEICKYLPPQSVILSAILPKWESIPNIVDQFMRKYDTTREVSLHRVSTDQVSISCAIIGPDGYLTMPHHFIEKKDDLDILIENMMSNPRIRRSYTPKHVFGWASDVKDLLESVSKNFEIYFPDISIIRHKDVLDFAIQMLITLRDNFEWLPRFQKYRPKLMESLRTMDTFTSQAFEYEGKTLFVGDNIMQMIDDISEPLLDGLSPINDLIDEMERIKSKSEALLRSIDKGKTKVGSSDRGGPNKEGPSKQERDLERQELLELTQNISMNIPDKFVINSIAHFHRFHPPAMSCPIKNPRAPVPVKTTDFDELDDMLSSLLYSGVALYSKEGMTSFEKSRSLSYYQYICFLCSGEEITFGTDLPGLVNIVITADFGERIASGVLYQLMGRAGRVGKSYHANIIAGSHKVLQKLLSYYDDEDYEAKEMDKNFLHF